MSTQGEKCAVADASARSKLEKAAPELLAALENLVNECQEARKYIDLSDDNGFAAYQAASIAVMQARAAMGAATG